MAIPVVLYVASASQGLPVLAVMVAGGRRPSASHLRVAVFCTVMVLSEVMNVVAAQLSGSNLWVSYFTMPTEVCLMFWILTLWQPNEPLRRFYRMALRIVAVLSAILLLVTDRVVAFEQWIAPLLALVALSAVLHTLIHNSLRSEQLLASQDWFWICLGLALFWMVTAPLPPFADALLASNLDWVRLAYLARAWISIGAFALISWGILCPRVLTRSYMPS